MKNPLVDALRQAQGDDPPDVSESESTAHDHQLPTALTDAETAPANLDSVANVIDRTAGGKQEGVPADNLDFREIDLLNTGRYSQSNLAQSEAFPAIEVVEETDIADASLDEFLDASSVESEILQPLAIEPSEGEHQMLPSAAMPNAQGDDAVRGMPLVPKLGRLSPLICLIALSASAAGYYRWTQLAALSLNSDLDGMAQIMSASHASLDGPGAGQSLPNSGQSVFTVQNATTGAIASGHTVGPMENSTGSSVVAPKTQFESLPAAVASVSVSRKAGPQVMSSPAREAGVDEEAHAYVQKGYGAYQARDLNRAEQHYADALVIEPHHKDALAGIAAVYVQTNRAANALAAYEQLLSVDPSNANAISGILTIQAGNSDSDRESELKHLIQQYPDADPLHYALGSLFVGQARWPDAKKAFLAAHEIAPDNANYSYNVAVSMENIGQHDAARNYYEIALASAGTNSIFDRQAVETRLETLHRGLKESL